RSHQHAGIATFAKQHVDDDLRRRITEELTELLFVKINSMLLQQLEEIARCVARQSGLMKTGVVRNEMIGSREGVREVAPAATGDLDFPAHRFVVLEHDDATSAFARFDRAHEAGGAAADDDDIKFQEATSYMIAPQEKEEEGGHAGDARSG